jgi:hypothetical protein
MKKLILGLVAIAAAASLTGCIQVNTSTDIKADGSGTASLAFGLSQSVAEAVKEMQALDPNSTGDMEIPDFADIERTNIDKVAKQYNVKVTAFEKNDTDGRLSMRMAFAFEDLRGLSAVMAAAMGEEPESGLGIYATADGDYVLKAATYEFPDYPELDKPEAESEEQEASTPGEMTPEQMQKQMELMGKLMGAMAEMDIQMRITVPGDIITTNAPAQEGRTSVWVVNSSNMMTAGADMEPEITFSGKGLKIKGALTE